MAGRKSGRKSGRMSQEQKDAMAINTKHKNVLRELPLMTYKDFTADVFANVQAAAAHLFPPIAQRGRTAGPSWARRFLDFIKDQNGSVRFTDVSKWSDYAAGKGTVKDWIRELIRDKVAWISDNADEVDNVAKKIVYTLVSEDGEPSGWTGYVYVPRKTSSDKDSSDN